jgi:hypothetical protein
VPGRHVTDHQMRLFMKFRQTEPVAVAAAKASMSMATAYRIQNDPRLPSTKAQPRERRRPDPLSAVFECQFASNRDPDFASNNDPSGCTRLGLSA